MPKSKRKKHKISRKKRRVLRFSKKGGAAAYANNSNNNLVNVENVVRSPAPYLEIVLRSDIKVLLEQQIDGCSKCNVKSKKDKCLEVYSNSCDKHLGEINKIIGSGRFGKVYSLKGNDHLVLKYIEDKDLKKNL